MMLFESLPVGLELPNGALYILEALFHAKGLDFLGIFHHLISHLRFLWHLSHKNHS